MVVFNVRYGLTLVTALYNTHYQSTLSVTGFVVARSGLGLPGLLVTRVVSSLLPMLYYVTGFMLPLPMPRYLFEVFT